MNKSIIALLACCLLAAGCVQLSLHPLYTDADLVFDPALVGTWAGKDSKETWSFTRGGSGEEYKFLYTDEDGKNGEFVAHLANVQGRLFLDIFPDEPKPDASDAYKWHLLGCHSFMRVLQVQPTLRVALLNPDWVKEFLKKHPKAIRHEIVDDTVILTADSKELQDFLIEHEKTGEAFDEPAELIRTVD